MTVMNDKNNHTILKEKLMKAAVAMVVVPLAVIYIVSGTLFSVFGAKYWRNPLEMLNDLDCSQWTERFLNECEQQYLYGQASSYSVWNLRECKKGDQSIFELIREEMNAAGYLLRIVPFEYEYDDHMFLDEISESGSFVKYLTMQDMDMVIVQKEIVTDEGVITITALNFNPEMNGKFLLWLCILFVSAYIVSLASFVNYVLRVLQQPLDLLRAGTKKIVKGNYDEQLSYQGIVEFEDLCNDFDIMRENLMDKEIREAEMKEQRSLMLRGMSHDLSTPLTAIRGYTEGLLEGYAEDESTKEKYLKTILTRSQDMERMLGKLSDFAKFTGDIEYHFEAVNIVQVIREYVEQLADEDEVKLNINDCEACSVCIDTNEFYRVFQNLYENALKYVEHRPVTIDITMEKRNDSFAVIFKDDGEGVMEDKTKEIFKAFYRADPARSKKGNGLGLAISRRIIEAHHGTIRAYNDNGFAVEIILPLYIEEKTDEEDTDH